MVHLLSRKPGYHDLRQQSGMNRYLHRLGDICRHIKSSHHGQPGHIRHGSLHKPLPKPPKLQRDWVLMEASLAPWNVDRAAPDTEYQPRGSDHDSAIDHALDALDLTNSEQTHTTVIWRPAVTHATRVVQPYEITRQAIDREVHHYHYLHKTLPITDFQVLPAKHFVENSRGSYTEVPMERSPLDAEDETTFLQVVDDTANREARARMESIQEVPSPMLSRNDQVYHLREEPRQQLGPGHTAVTRRRATTRSTDSGMKTVPMPTLTQRGPYLNSGVADNHSEVDKEGSYFARHHIQAPVPPPFQEGVLQSSPAEVEKPHLPTISGMAYRKEPFFAQDVPRHARPIASTTGGNQLQHSVHHGAMGSLAPMLDSVDIPSPKDVLTARHAGTLPPSSPWSRSRRNEQHSLPNRLPHSPAESAGPATPMFTGTAIRGDSAARSSQGLQLNYKESCPSCGAPKLVTSPTMPSLKGTASATVSAPAPLATAEMKETRAPSTLARSPTDYALPSAYARNGLQNRSQDTNAKEAPIAVRRAPPTDETRLANPSSVATSAEIPSQPRPASKRMYLDYSNLWFGRKVDCRT